VNKVNLGIGKFISKANLTRAFSDFCTPGGRMRAFLPVGHNQDVAMVTLWHHHKMQKFEKKLKNI